MRWAGVKSGFKTHGSQSQAALPGAVIVGPNQWAQVQTPNVALKALRNSALRAPRGLGPAALCTDTKTWMTGCQRASSQGGSALGFPRACQARFLVQSRLQKLLLNAESTVLQNKPQRITPTPRDVRS